ncbi:phosphopantetheine-binding protein [Bdellovibrio sp. KM01]|uniref:phosphopantetheine-binding protein n=1 Tax=Bdellovibrio sp. KM01 TaxID=2748865 RepID=UPI0015E93F5D|nr:phosphopantetheine-binding protein [Bdellovibrio sp. KM01]QLY24428.1 acyl carrier protein [Bdellovibrio sp. KM01]
MSHYSTQVVDIVNNILHEKFEVPKDALVPTANLKEDLQLDSLDFVDMFILLEQETGKNPQNVDFMKIKNLGDIYQLVSELTVQETVN